jgi:hypothetical protein
MKIEKIHVISAFYTQKGDFALCVEENNLNILSEEVKMACKADLILKSLSLFLPLSLSLSVLSLYLSSFYL